ncbi:MAG TPA: uracil-DNA glycosylase [Sulfurospirillum sp. UBA11407]|nr:MAG TPA: uracil-DNA glycosylase [Sulfurospirillum sp. UBA11407]
MPLHVHDSWQEIIEYAYKGLNPKYRAFLEENESYFPKYNQFLNAFKTLPLEQTKYILFGQDPYPREKSAIGYAFIDGAVSSLFSKDGFSKEVNRATSLRNFLKMLLVANGTLTCKDVSQSAIAKIEKKDYINSIYELKDNFEKNGILLLNTALIFSTKEETKYHIKEFQPFMQRLLGKLFGYDVKLILFGNMAKDIQKSLPNSIHFSAIKTLHPYNIGFISDSSVQDFFKPMNLLVKR